MRSVEIGCSSGAEGRCGTNAEGCNGGANAEASWATKSTAVLVSLLPSKPRSFPLSRQQKEAAAATRDLLKLDAARVWKAGAPPMQKDAAAAPMRKLPGRPRALPVPEKRSGASSSPRSFNDNNYFFNSSADHFFSSPGQSCSQPWNPQASDPATWKSEQYWSDVELTYNHTTPSHRARIAKQIKDRFHKHQSGPRRSKWKELLLSHLTVGSVNVDGECAEAICGRLLDLQFYAKTDDLYIVDVYLGLMNVVPSGGKATVLVMGADGVPFNFVNGVDVDQGTSNVYFTDSITTYTREHNTGIMINRDATMRLLKFNARTRHVTVLMAGLPYTNGVAMSADRTHVVVAHRRPCQAFRHEKGGYWFALNREQINATSPKDLVGVRVDTKGGEHGVMKAPKGFTLSDIVEKDDKLWLGSVELDYVGLAS
ncbi:hypothetical protein HU200_046991 [Digitaria exilis]|uniref:Strictosidine synthase conserved region domain-containing protein n=1 Tax=Digitaria exilis TaxID=1010633 RepID=A0A835E8Y6_9POAL|nr:hypothetical protein HU200_046991 [Digitaria exilis]